MCCPGCTHPWGAISGLKKIPFIFQANKSWRPASCILSSGGITWRTTQLDLKQDPCFMSLWWLLVSCYRIWYLLLFFSPPEIKVRHLVLVSPSVTSTETWLFIKGLFLPSHLHHLHLNLHFKFSASFIGETSTEDMINLWRWCCVSV